MSPACHVFEGFRSAWRTGSLGQKPCFKSHCGSVNVTHLCRSHASKEVLRLATRQQIWEATCGVMCFSLCGQEISERCLILNNWSMMNKWPLALPQKLLGLLNGAAILILYQTPERSRSSKNMAKSQNLRTRNENARMQMSNSPGSHSYQHPRIPHCLTAVAQGWICFCLWNSGKSLKCQRRCFQDCLQNSFPRICPWCPKGQRRNPKISIEPLISPPLPFPSSHASISHGYLLWLWHTLPLQQCRERSGPVLNLAINGGLQKNGDYGCQHPQDSPSCHAGSKPSWIAFLSESASSPAVHWWEEKGLVLPWPVF